MQNRARGKLRDKRGSRARVIITSLSPRKREADGPARAKLANKRRRRARANSQTYRCAGGRVYALVVVLLVLADGGYSEKGRCDMYNGLDFYEIGELDL